MVGFLLQAVGEKTLEELIQEVEAAEKHERQVKLLTRASYSHHYRRIMPALLEVLSFQCNNCRAALKSRIDDLYFSTRMCDLTTMSLH